jgi:hypothetical protein
MWQNNTGQSVGLLPGRQTFGPLALMLVTAPFVMLIWYANAHLDGSLYALLPYFQVRTTAGPPPSKLLLLLLAPNTPSRRAAACR